MVAVTSRFKTGRGRTCDACLLLILSMPLQLLADASPEPTTGNASIRQLSILVPAAIDFNAAVVASISIQNGSIFDLDEPQENKALYRLANRAHITTRTNVIYQQLLFREGEKLSSSALQESERILRGNRYIQDASIETVQQEDGTVDVNVRTSDVWTLIPKVSFSRSGGENKSNIGIREMNLLGTGMEVEAFYRSNVDRDSTIVRFADRHLGDSW
jgi:outer membrane protein assembly factor BamA